jgi:hypothetical protein
MTCAGNLSFVARTTQTSQTVPIRFWSCLKILLGSAFACTMVRHRIQLSVTAPGAARICPRNPASLALTVRHPQCQCMRLIQHLKQWQVRRRYRAALTIYVAAYTYRHLCPDDQNRISDWVRHLIDGKFNPAFSFKEFELFLPVHAKAAFWAVAMKSLAIPPAVPGEVWQIPVQPRWRSRFSVVNKLLRDWRPYNTTTNKVQDYLKSKDVDVTTMDLQAR